MAEVTATTNTETDASTPAPESTVGKSPIPSFLETYDHFDDFQTIEYSPSEYLDTPPSTPGPFTPKNIENSCKSTTIDHTAECSGCGNGSGKLFLLGCLHVLCLKCTTVTISKDNNCPRCNTSIPESICDKNPLLATEWKTNNSENSSNYYPADSCHGIVEKCDVSLDESSEASLGSTDMVDDVKGKHVKILDLAIFNFLFSIGMIIFNSPIIYEETLLLLAFRLTLSSGEWFRFAGSCLMLGISVNTFTCKLGELGHWFGAKIKKGILSHKILKRTAELLLGWSNTPISITRSLVMLANLSAGWLLLFSVRFWIIDATGIPELLIHSIYKRIVVSAELLGFLCVIGLWINPNMPLQSLQNMVARKKSTPGSALKEVDVHRNDILDVDTRLQSSHFHLKWLETRMVATPWDIFKFFIVFGLSFLQLIAREARIKLFCPKNALGLCSFYKYFRDETWAIAFCGWIMGCYIIFSCFFEVGRHLDALSDALLEPSGARSWWLASVSVASFGLIAYWML